MGMRKFLPGILPFMFPDGIQGNKFHPDKRSDDERLAIIQRESDRAKAEREKKTDKAPKRKKLTFSYKYKKGFAVINGESVAKNPKKLRVLLKSNK